MPKLAPKLRVIKEDNKWKIGQSGSKKVDAYLVLSTKSTAKIGISESFPHEIEADILHWLGEILVVIKPKQVSHQD